MSYDSHIQIDLKPALAFDNYKLYHTGCSKAHGDIFVPYHVHHNFYELTVFTKGSGFSYVGEVPQAVKKGDIFVSFPFEKHRVDSAPDDFLSYHFISYNITSPKFSGKLKRLWLENVPPENRIIKCDMAIPLIDSVINELQNGRGKYSDELISSALEQLTVYMLRGFSDRISEKLPNTPTDEELCRHTAHYIDTHLFSMKQLKECSEALNYNYCYLSTVFRNVYGCTLSDYYRSKRLDMAKSLIQANELSFSEIAESLNYSGISAFSKAFKLQFGMSPRDYSKSGQKS